MNPITQEENSTPNLSLFLNGPLYNFYLKARLVKSPLLWCQRRVIFICLITWLPLLMLSLVEGVSFRGTTVPFIHDINVHVRFLLALPLILYAEVLANDRFQMISNHFLKNHLIAAPDKNRFAEIVRSTMRGTQSVTMEIILLLFVIFFGKQISNYSFIVGNSNWYVSTINNAHQLSLPGYWYAFISLPLFQFILLRWYYRLTLWYSFLWKVSRLNLQLNSLHPDRAGGLGFLTLSINAVLPFLLAHSVLFSGLILSRIWNNGVTLLQFQNEIICLTIFLILLPIIPLLFFMLLMAKVKRIGTLEYDNVANVYVQSFWQKWMRITSNDTMLGNSDFQSLADLANSFEVTAKMRILPFSRNSILLIIIIILLPLIPLVFTLIPIEKVLHQTLGLLF